jgi:hypothetical protein
MPQLVKPTANEQIFETVTICTLQRDAMAAALLALVMWADLSEGGCTHTLSLEMHVDAASVTAQSRRQTTPACTPTQTLPTISKFFRRSNRAKHGSHCLTSLPTSIQGSSSTARVPSC